MKIAPQIEETTGLLKNLPGTVGLISTGIHHGTKAIRESVEKVPNEEVKKKLEEKINDSGSVTVTPEGKIIPGSNQTHSNTNKDILAKAAVSVAENIFSPSTGGMIRSFYKQYKKRRKKK
jgi:hypothetical protein